MDRFFSVFPKSLLAVLVIGGGIFFIISSDPPHTVCESQTEVFRVAQNRFLFVDPKQKPKVTIAKYRALVDRCKSANTPGGCYELFQEARMLIRDLEAVPSECATVIGAITEVKTALWELTELLVRLGWGDKPPVTYHQKFAWLDTSDISLFCRLKKRLVESYEELAFQEFRERIFKDLPGSKDMPREQVWDMTIFSENCAKYP